MVENTSVDYRDPTHIDPVNPNDTSGLDDETKELLAELRNKMYGVDVREVIARLFERMFKQVTDLIPDDTEDNNQSSQFDELTERINRIILGTDQQSIKLVVTQILKDEGVI
ncbi:hypothetical protein [Loigolactobacillus binensis]|uniref:Uncharacterized protein n=1 Tax=Loigolactobacillus binensis TaxID=2559922 RepID=A0ABW3ED24_9LACO|nr:hypothetical protein [Loigolactobacillus binensis]